MIKSVTVINHRGETCKIVLSESDPAHGLLITKITGIGPGDAIINTSDFATNDGSEFNSARLSYRSIQLTIVLSDDNDVMTIEKARHNSYKYFPLKRQVRLIFETDDRHLYIDGRVANNEPTIFTEKSKRESITVDITCPDPYFYKYIPGTDSREVVDIMVVNPAFEFTETEVETDEYQGELENPYEVGEYSAPGDLVKTIPYDGEVEAGFEARIRLVGELQGDIILSRYGVTGEYFRIDKDKLIALTGGLNNGDEIVFSTDPKLCYCKIIQNGIETNVLNAVDLDNSTWLLLYPGNNTFQYAVIDGLDYTRLTIIYKTLFIGV